MIFCARPDDVSNDLRELCTDVAESKCMSAEDAFVLLEIIDDCKTLVPGLLELPEERNQLGLRMCSMALNAIDSSDYLWGMCGALAGLAATAHDPLIWWCVARCAFDVPGNMDSADRTALAMRSLEHALWIHPGFSIARTDLRELHI